MIIDLHAHAFPDAVAARAIPALEAHAPAGVRAFFDGRLSTLVDELARNRIDAAVICSIATKPGQFQPILDWSVGIAAGAYGMAAAAAAIPFASVHPSDPEAFGRLAQVARAGIKGIKLHPYYQSFVLDDAPVLEFLRCCRDQGLIVICHTGFDMAFPRDRICDPVRIAAALDAVPGLEFVATHLGGWEDWDEVERVLIGRPVNIEISFALDYLPAERMASLLRAHPADRLFFGTDWPWHPHDRDLAAVRRFGLEPEREAALLGLNAQRLLRL